MEETTSSAAIGRRMAVLSLAIALGLAWLTATPQNSYGAPLPALLLAQGSDTFTPGESEADADGLLDFNGWVLEVLMIALAFLLAMVFGFVVLFRWLLRRNYWPLTAYGISMSFVLFVTFSIALWVLWEDLVLDSQGGPVTTFMVVGGRVGLGSAGVLLIIVVLSYFRSPHSGNTSTA